MMAYQLQVVADKIGISVPLAAAFFWTQPQRYMNHVPVMVLLHRQFS